MEIVLKCIKHQQRSTWTDLISSEHFVVDEPLAVVVDVHYFAVVGMLAVAAFDPG